MTEKKTSPFSQEFLDKIKGILLEQKTEIEEKLGELVGDKEHEARFVDYGNSQDDNAHEVADWELNRSTTDTLDKQLRDINGALKRLEEGTYGICKYTGKPIEEKRLLARPTSSASLAAKQMLENS